MQILEHGQEHERTLLFFPCTAEPVWAFADTIAQLSQRWHVFQVVYDGHQPEYPGDFTSVEQTVDEVISYLKSRSVSRLDGAYQAARNYWKVTKKRLKDEGNETVTACNQLKMTASDGKKRLTDVADTEQLLRIIQSIPSPKAEPFKLWLAQVGRERIEETIDPELTIDRALETYLKKGYSREWINQRLQAIQVRKELTDEWDARGVQKGVEYAILTDEISRAWSGMSTRQYKNLKGLKKENLRDNMTTLELVLNMLAEATTTQFSRDRKPTTFQENLAVAKAGGQVAGRTRKDIESQSDTPVITAKNAAQLNQVVTDLLEGAVSDTTEESKDK